MVERWSPYEIQLSCFMLLAVLYEIRECDAMNVEGLALLEFQERIEDDPHGAFLNWNSNSREPCLWLGVYCMDGKVQMLNLGGFSLQGTLAPGLRKLRYLKFLVLNNNCLSGPIPKEIGQLKLLEMLDLSYNNLTGAVPTEIQGIPSLKCMCLLGNRINGDVPPNVRKVGHYLDFQRDQNSQNCPRKKPVYDKLGNRRVRACGEKCCRILSAENSVSRYLVEESSNRPALPANVLKPSIQDRPVVLSSGAFPALVNHTKHLPPPPSDPSKHSPPPPSDPTKHSPPPPSLDGGSIPGKMGCIIIALTVSIAILAGLALFCIYCRKTPKDVRPLDAGLLHQLSKAFVTGVPQLNSAELQTACEDFSNIIDTFPGCVLYKGILSSGVEIAVVYSTIASAKQWTVHAQREFKRKVSTLSRVNHKNFVNLIGYCEEEEPFVRMMVFEYASNGNLYEHLHVEDAEHLDWNVRMRIIMGVSYCLEHMHHYLNPPVVLSNVQSDVILLNEDYSAKVLECRVWTDIKIKSEIPDDEESKHYAKGPTSKDPAFGMKENVYSFGILLLETISRKYATTEDGSLADWVVKYLNNKENVTASVDPSLTSFRNKDLEVVCEVASQCVNDDPLQRPSMIEVTAQLRQVINISPDAAVSKISPLWWAELEILSEAG